MRIVSRIKDSLIGKLIVSFILFIISPLLIMGGYTFISTTNYVTENYVCGEQTVLKSLDRCMQTYFDEFSNLTYNAMISENIRRILEANAEDTVTRYQCQQSFDEFAENLLGHRSDVESAYLIDRTGVIYYSSNTNTNSDVNNAYDFYESDWFQPLAESNGEFVLLGSHYQDMKSRPTYRYVLSAARKIRNLDTGETLGYFLIDIKSDIFQKLLWNEDNAMRRIIVVDDAKRIIYDPDVFSFRTTQYWVQPGDTLDSISERLHVDLDDLMRDNRLTADGSLAPGRVLFVRGSALDWKDVYPDFAFPQTNGRAVTEKSELYIATCYGGAMGWTLVSLVEQTSLLLAIRDILYPQLIIGALCAVLFVLISLAISRSIIHPIQLLNASMQEVAKGDFEQKVKQRFGGEVGMLAATFNEMVEKIQQLIDSEYRARIQRLQAEFYALQAQINPHFLYNTLDSINSIAQIKRQPEISEIIQALAKTLRYTTRRDEEYVSLKQELDHVKNYIVVQAFCYDDQFVIRYDISKEAMGTWVIKFLLQPIVENAIIHGMEEVDHGGVILVRAFCQDHFLRISVANNGKAIEPEKLAALQRRLSHPLEEDPPAESDGRSIGLCNIASRLKLYYGSSAELRLDSQPGAMTVVSLKIPL